MRSNIGFPVVRTDGGAVYGQVITKFSGMGRVTFKIYLAVALHPCALRACVSPLLLISQFIVGK